MAAVARGPAFQRLSRHPWPWTGQDSIQLSTGETAPLIQPTGLRVLGYHFSCVEFDEHGSVGVEVLDRDEELKVVEEQELQFQMVQFRKRQTADLLLTCN